MPGRQQTLKNDCMSTWKFQLPGDRNRRKCFRRGTSAVQKDQKAPGAVIEIGGSSSQSWRVTEYAGRSTRRPLP